MKYKSITGLSSLIFLSAFIAFMISAGGGRAHAQSTHTITINNNCSETIWIGASAAQAIQSVTIGGQAVTTLGGWELAQNETAIVQVPLTWLSGRFWARTGCKFQSDGICPAPGVGNNPPPNCCDTGGCVWIQQGSSLLTAARRAPRRPRLRESPFHPAYRRAMT